MEALKRFIVIAVLLTGLVSKAHGQNIFIKYLKYTLMDTSPPAKPKFIGYPTLAYAPETDWELGISGLLVYRAKQDTNNRLSEVKTFSFVTLQQQYGTVLEHALYTDQNQFYFRGELRFQSFPIEYYGIGPHTNPDLHVIVNTNELRVRERVLYQFAPSWFTGFEADFQRLSKVSIDWEDKEQDIGIPLGSEGSGNLSLGYGIVYDNLHNVLNPREGAYLELAYLGSRTGWGSRYSFNTVQTDLRVYHPVRKRNVLATQFVGQFGAGDIPFNALAQMGGEQLMRGYYRGRYRDQNYAALQLEYRMLPFPFAKRWGASVFAGSGLVFPSFNDVSTDYLRWAVGAGPRFLLFPKKDVYNRLDVAFTKEGMGFYFHIGEAF